MIPRLVSRRPIASTSTLPCPGCRSSSILLAPTNLGIISSTTPRGNSWTGQSGLGDSDSRSSIKRVKVKKVENLLVKELSNELLLAQPNSLRVWQLFNQIDLQGNLSELKNGIFDLVIKSLYQVPLKLDLESSISLGREYEQKLEFIKLRMNQLGIESQGINSAALKQFATLQYAPGLCQIYDQLLLQKTPNSKLSATIFQGLVGWINLHKIAGGKLAAKAAAIPLVTKSVNILAEISITKRAQIVMNSFFQIIQAAEDFPVFKQSMMAVYGFDIDLPGSELQLEQSGNLKRVGEEEILWILSMLDIKNDLSSMIAVFETADAPTPPLSNYFESSFHPSSSKSPALTLPNPFPHPIGTKAFTQIITTAARLNQGIISRHYFKQLSLRWEEGINRKINTVEKAVGIEKLDTKALKSGDELEAQFFPLPTVADSTIDSTVTVEEPATIIDRPLIASPSPVSSTSVINFQSPPITPTILPAPLRDYQIPSTLIYSVLKESKTSYDAASTSYIRARTLHTLHLMDDQIKRILKVVEKLDGVKTVSSTKAVTVVAKDGGARDGLLHEIEKIEFHRIQLRFMLGRIKSESNIVYAYGCLRRLIIDLNRLQKKSQTTSGQKEIQKLKLLGSTLRAKTRKIAMTKKILIRQRMGKIYEEGNGNSKNDAWVKCIRELGELEEGDRWIPIDRSLKLEKVKVEEVL